MCCCMPALLSTLRRFFPVVFGSTKPAYNYKYNDTPPAERRGIQKSVTHDITYTTTDEREEDAVELVDRGEEQGKW